MNLDARSEGFWWRLAMLRQSRWIVYYNGACTFCGRWVNRARRITLGQVQWRDFQQHAKEVAHLHPRFDRSAYLIIGNTLALPGFEGFRVLLFAMPILWVLIPLCYLPGSRRLGSALYRYISTRYGPVDNASACASAQSVRSR